MTALYCRLYEAVTAFKGNACEKFALGSATVWYSKIQILILNSNTLVSNNILKKLSYINKNQLPSFSNSNGYFSRFTGDIKSLHNLVKTPGFNVGKKWTFNYFNASN